MLYLGGSIPADIWREEAREGRRYSSRYRYVTSVSEELRSSIPVPYHRCCGRQEGREEGQSQYWMLMFMLYDDSI